MPGRNDIDLRVGVDGVRETNRKLKQTEDQVKKVGKSTEKTANDVSRSSTRLFGKLRTMVRGMGGFFASIASFATIARKEMQATEQQVDSLKSKFDGIRETLSLGRDPKLIETINSLQIQAGLPGAAGFSEINEAINSLRSKSANLDDATRKNILTEAVELRQITSTPLKTLTDLLLFQQKAAPDKTPAQLQNILKQTQIEAGANLPQLAQFLPQLLEIGKAAGLSQEQTSAFFATATAVQPDVARSTTGLRNIFSILQSEGTPEQEELKNTLGLTSDSGIISQLEKLSGQSPNIETLTTLFGRENVTLSAALLPAIASGGFGKTLGRIESASAGGKDLVQEDIRRINDPRTVIGKEFILRREQAKEEVLRFQQEGGADLNQKIFQQKIRNDIIRTGTFTEIGVDIVSGAAGLIAGVSDFGEDVDPKGLRTEAPRIINTGTTIIHNQTDGNRANSKSKAGS